MIWVYVKGSWTPAEEAKISIAERGFRYGDGVFETIRVQNGKAVFLHDHLTRMQQGLAALKIPKPVENISQLCSEVTKRNAQPSGIIRLSVSRGISGRGYLPAAPQPPTVVLEWLELPSPPAVPLSLWLATTRKITPDCLPVQHKLMQGVNSALARMEAQENHCDEALMLNAAGEICEASSANIFWRDADGGVYTPALECGVLAGIGRKQLLAHWPQPIKQGRYMLADLQAAREVIVINSITGPVVVNLLTPQGWQWQSAPLLAKAQAVWQKATLKEGNA